MVACSLCPKPALIKAGSITLSEPGTPDEVVDFWACAEHVAEMAAGVRKFQAKNPFVYRTSANGA